MKCFLINFCVFIVFVNSHTRKPLFQPQLPVGEYRVHVLGLLQCESMTRQIQFNYHLSKTSVNTTEMKGNITFLEAWNDSFNIEVNMAVKDSIGGWKDNAHIFKTPNACSSLKQLLGNSWNSVLDIMGMHNLTCPIPAGCYKTPGVNINENFGNLPKRFFYGTYKFRFQYTRNKVIHGCTTAVIEVKRPWETDF